MEMSGFNWANGNNSNTANGEIENKNVYISLY